MADARFLPTTRIGKLERLIEECAEVIIAAQKLKRFGTDIHVVDGVEYDNITKLHDEMQDLEGAMASVRCVDLTKLESR